MGGKGGGDQTIGYKHYLGVQAVFCSGPIDSFSRITCDDRIAWAGIATSGQITVSADTLFGGDDREGGLSGVVDIEMGAPTQVKNAYLLSVIGPGIPAYRGVAAMVFNDFYWGNNPYLKPVRARGTRIHVAQDGATQWYDAKAEIGGTTTGGPTMVLDTAEWKYTREAYDSTNTYEAEDFDDSGWSTGLMPFGSEPWTQPSDEGFRSPPVSTYLTQESLHLRRLLYLPTPVASFQMNAFVDNGWTVWVNGVEVFTDYNAFGHSNSQTIPGSHFRVGNNTIYIKVVDDATHTIGVDKAYFDLAIPDIIVGQSGDMNPAHIIRECLTNADWGMGYDPADIDDVSFTAAADTLYDEGLGISILWQQQATLESFINEIIRHIDAALFVSRTTGQFKLKLIRADYDVDTLPVFDESNIDKFQDPSRAAWGELINSVSVQFWSITTGRDDSLTVQDPAGVQQQGSVINTTVQYAGFTNHFTAQVAGARDLRALSNAFFGGTIYTGNDARDLEPGSVIKVGWAKWGIAGMVMRVTGVAVAEGKSESIRLTVVEDVFATNVNVVVAPPPEGGGWVDPSQPPVAALAQLTLEAPYYELVQAGGQTHVNNELATDHTLGLVGAAAVRADNSINAKVWTDAGSGFTVAGTLDFCPSGLLAAAIGKTDTAATLAGHVDLDLITLGTHFQIDDELLRIDTVNKTTGAITFGRGVLDTVPAAHAAGARAFFWDAYSGVDPTQYVTGETIDVRVTPVSGQGVLPLADAANGTVTLAGRAWRPYPPGDLKINGDSYLDNLYTGVLTPTWVGRDRLLQTGGVLADHFDGAIGPEAGTTYRIRAYLNGTLVDTIDPAVSGGTYTPPGDGLVRIDADSKRDGVYSWQAASHEFQYLTAGAGRSIEAGDDRYTEAGESRVTEG